MSVTFADIIPVKQVSSHEYTVELDDAWCIGTVPNGGYVTSAFMVVARTHMQTTHARLNQADVINLHLEFLRRTSTGPAIFKVTDVKIGSRISNLHLTLCQNKDMSDPKSQIQDEVQGYFTISNISNETGPTNITKYRLHPLPLPVSLEELATKQEDTNYILRRGDRYGKFRRAANHTAMHLIKPSRRPPGLQTPGIIDQWIRFRPVRPASSPTAAATNSPATEQNHVPGAWTNDSLGYISDIFPQLHERYVNSDLEDSILQPESQTSTTTTELEIPAAADNSKNNNSTKTDNVSKKPKTLFWYPTLVLNLDIKRLLPRHGLEWLFVRVWAKTMTNGRFDLQVEIWDDPIQGDLIATSNHACLIVDAGRNIKRSSSSSPNANLSTTTTISKSKI